LRVAHSGSGLVAAYEQWQLTCGAIRGFPDALSGQWQCVDVVAPLSLDRGSGQYGRLVDFITPPSAYQTSMGFLSRFE